MTTLTTDLLENLVAQLRAQSAPIVEYLAPGLSDAHINAVTAPLGLTLPEEAKVWWRFSNGVPRDAPEGAATVGREWWWAPLEEAAGEYQRIRGIVTSVYEDDESQPWPAHWFPPVIGSAALALDASGAEIAPIYAADLDDAPSDHLRPILPSFGALIEAWTTALREGAMRFDQHENVFVVDIEQLAALKIPQEVA